MDAKKIAQSSPKRGAQEKLDEEHVEELVKSLSNEDLAMSSPRRGARMYSKEMTPMSPHGVQEVGARVEPAEERSLT